MLKRKENLQGQLDSQFTTMTAFDLVAGGHAHFDVAPKVTILGSLSVAKAVGLGAIVRCINTDVAVHYVAIGAAAMAAPTGMTDGIAIPAGQLVTINTADLGDYVRSDDAKVGGYLVYRDTILFSPPDVNA